MSSRRKHNPASSMLYSIMYGLLIGAFVGFVIAAGVFVITREGYSRIDTIHVTGTRAIDSADIQIVLEQALQEDCFLHAPCGYGLWLPTEYTSRRLSVEFPRIDRVSLVYSEGTLSVVVQERDIAFRFCLDAAYQYCYFADKNSVLFERAPLLSDVRYLPTVLPDTTKISIGIVGESLPVRLWSQAEVDQYNNVMSVVQSFARPYVVRYTRRDMQIEVDKLYDYSLVADTASLKFNRESLGDTVQLAYITASLDRLSTFQPFSSQFTANPALLEYLDFRFPKRMYMKFAGGSSDVADSVDRPSAATH